MPKDRLLFEKTGRARFQRAFLRADIPIKHTEGFNPHPFISIALPLSLGFSSECEILEFGLLEGTGHADVPARLNAVLPEGVRVKECYSGERPLKELAALEYRMTLELDGDKKAESWFKPKCNGKCPVRRMSRFGPIFCDLSPGTGVG